jgi:hypothetical protein
MKRSELAVLERAFCAEIDGNVYQTKSKIAKKLEEEGYLVTKQIEFSGRFPVIVKGYVTSIRGNMAYCDSLKDI